MAHFRRTIVEVEVLSEEEWVETDLLALHEAITTGACSGVVRVTHVEEVDGPTMARLLIAQGSDPGFFMLTETGEPAEE
jgi:hypothetical protein